MTQFKLTAIMSGGQTGAERGGLDAAIELGLGYGGWAPAGWRAEDGEIPEIYQARMRCTSSAEYGMRTRLNVQDTDGTLLLSFGQELSGGSAFTEKTAERMRKPYLHLVLPDRGRTRIPDEVRTELLDWISACRISVLNVAGPRESKEPGLQAAVRDALVWIFEEHGDSVPAIEHAIGCDSVGAAGFNCAGCERDLCWNCESPLPAGHEIKTAVRWCKADACRAAEARERGTFLVSREQLYETDPVAPALAGVAIDADGIDIRARSVANYVVPTVGVIHDVDPTAVDRAFVADCEVLTGKLRDAGTARNFRDSVNYQIERYYEMPGNEAGGSLHVVLDDGNTERANVEYCLVYAGEKGDVAGAALANLLLAIPDDERGDVLRGERPQCGDCGAEIIEYHACEGVPGGFGDDTQTSEET